MSLFYAVVEKKRQELVGRVEFLLGKVLFSSEEYNPIFFRERERERER